MGDFIEESQDFWVKKSRLCENFATSRKKKIRPCFNKPLTFFIEGRFPRTLSFYFANEICQNFCIFCSTKIRTICQLHPHLFPHLDATSHIHENKKTIANWLAPIDDSSMIFLCRRFQAQKPNPISAVFLIKQSLFLVFTTWATTFTFATRATCRAFFPTFWFFLKHFV